MATALTKTASLIGLDAHIVNVEADVFIGLGIFTIVGLPDNMIKESRERIMSAINNQGGGFPIRKVIVNLAPADLKKIGTGFDLPIALAILEAFGRIPKGALEDFLLIGELSLNGSIRPINGVLAIALAAKEKGIKKIIIPAKNAEEAALVDGLEIYKAESLAQIIDCFKRKVELPIQKHQILKIAKVSNSELDYSEVHGHRKAKRALEIVAAGNHNILFSGPPGSGKTMLAKRLGTILPALSFKECLEITRIQSVAGLLNQASALVTERSFRHPHHSISVAGLVGGGSIPKPGEVSLAHRGVLFLDELAEFSRAVLDQLRQPLEDGVITISRAALTLSFPTNFILIAAMNPCPCGYLGDKKHDCSCSLAQIQRYRARVSGPLLDRIDLQVEIPNLPYEKINQETKEESSKEIQQRILKARDFQNKRYPAENFLYNSELGTKEITEYCKLNDAGHNMLAAAFNKLGLSGRAHNRILKVSRTIADLEQSSQIEPRHLAEAISYRCLEQEIKL